MITLPCVLLTLSALGQSGADRLKSNQYPAWFRDGKLGIWAHWGPQSVPMEGDWYARNMYVQGERQYDDHLKRYGHPSKAGYKDIIPLWKAEKWDPDRLMTLYKEAGATYFVSMAVHHDNFDLWDSKYNRWNAVNMGPKRDVVGVWQASAKKHGLRFGVSEHLGASFTWFQVSRGSDKEGPMACVPYDGVDPANQDLYHAKAQPDDTNWYTHDSRFQEEWFRRISDLVDHYHPDLLYSDGPFPFGHFGQDLISHFYEESRARNGGEQTAVYTCKQPSEGKWAQDVERGVLGGIQEFPWQTDTSIGDWFYNKGWKYRHADWVIKTLVDVVSKNGNLLINVVQRPDGSLDPEAEQVLVDMAKWMEANGESIYGTRPWITFGEGAVKARGGAFREDFGFTASDIRYVTKGENTVYATLLGKPKAGEILLKTLSKEGSKASITGVSVLGYEGKVAWYWDQAGLHVTLPDAPFSEIATVVKIEGANLREFVLPEPPVTFIEPDKDGVFSLDPELADLHGEGIGTETRDGKPNLAYWDRSGDYASWTLDVKAAGDYDVEVEVASQKAGSVLNLLYPADTAASTSQPPKVGPRSTKFTRGRQGSQFRGKSNSKLARPVPSTGPVST